MGQVIWPPGFHSPNCFRYFSWKVRSVKTRDLF